MITEVLLESTYDERMDLRNAYFLSNNLFVSCRILLFLFYLKIVILKYTKRI